MGIFDVFGKREKSEIKVVDGKKVLIKFDDQDLTSEGSYTVSPKVSIIGSNAFNNSSITSITIPDTCTYISNGAFRDCQNLSQINISEHSLNFGAFSFCGCESLEEITIPEGETVLRVGLFQNCKNLKRVNLSEKVTRIVQGVFDGCDSLEELTLPGSLKIIEQNFALCKNLKRVKISSGMEKINQELFNGCSSLEEVIIPETVQTIESGAFKSCKNLKHITLSDGLNVISEKAFANCSSLQTITIPDSVSIIGSGAFGNCQNLHEVILPTGLQALEELCFVGSNIEQIIIPEGIQEIKRGTFSRCSNLQTITLPKSLKSIGNNAFRECYSLQEITLPNGIEKINDGAFMFCSSLKSLTIPETVTSIGVDAFTDCYSLENIIILGKTSISGAVFNGCSNLKSITLPNGLTPGSVLDIASTNITEIVYKGKKIPLTPELRRNFSEAIPFIEYAIEHNKFIPRNITVLTHTNPKEIENFYAHAKEWQTLLNAYVNKWNTNSGVENRALEFATEALYKLSVALGLFQNGEAGVRASTFINESILKLSPIEIHSMFQCLNTKSYGFNEEFAKFFIKNYREPYMEDGETKYFMHTYFPIDESTNAFIARNYIETAYNNWAYVKEAFPNKTVVSHRERGSIYNNLTFEDIVHALNSVIYENIFDGNEKLAEMVSRCGYPQEDFDYLQALFEEGKNVKGSMILSAAPDLETTGITYQLLAKDDPEGFVIGVETNCCQKLHGPGQACMVYGATKPNSGFIKFSLNGRIVGQSWVWYNEETKEVCLDNIEIPKTLLKFFASSEQQQSFKQCLERLAVALKIDMEKNGYPVKEVTIGGRNNDLLILSEYETRESDVSVLPRDYSDYSDADEIQHVIPIKIAEKRNDQIER